MTGDEKKLVSRLRDQGLTYQEISQCPGPERADNRKVWYNRSNTEGGRKRWDAGASSAVKRRSRR